MQTSTVTTERTYPDRSELPEMLGMFAMIHDAMRRDSNRLVPAAANIRTAGDAAELLQWWTKFTDAIVHHHEREDDVLWPDLRRRDPGFALDEEGLREDHAALDGAMDRMSAVLAAAAEVPTGSFVGNAAIVEAAATFADIIWDHLAREEEAAFGRIERANTPDEYQELEKQVGKGTKLSAMAFLVPWLIGGGEPTAEQKALAPALLLFMYRLFWRSSYARLSAPLAGARRR